MIKLAHPEALYLLLLLIPLGLAFLWYLFSRRKAIRKWGVESLTRKSAPQAPGYKHLGRFILAALALIMLVMALANPQIGRTREKVKRQGVDLVLALDISRSMLAEDVKPNRLERARLLLSRLLDRLGGDRVALVVFAGNAYMQVPLTTDYVAVKSILRTLNPDIAPTQGTAIGEAIELAEEAFEAGQTQYKAMVVVSDGETHEGQALEMAKKAAENGMVIHTVGVGTPNGAPIPVYANGAVTDYKRDREGSIVLSKLNETMLRQVAAAGSGEYLLLQQGNTEVNQIRAALAGMEKQEFEDYVFTDYEDQFQWFLGLAFVLLVIEAFLSEKRSQLFSNWAIFKSDEEA